MRRPCVAVARNYPSQKVSDAEIAALHIEHHPLGPQVELHDSTPYFVLHFNMTPGRYSIYGTVVRTFELALAFQYPVHHRSRGQSNVANVDVVLACSLRVKRRAVIERALVNHRI